MKTIPADQVDQAGRALVVRYQSTSEDPSAMQVQIIAQVVEGDPEHVERCEFAVVCWHEVMSEADMRARVDREGEARAIDRVAWIDESGNQ